MFRNWNFLTVEFGAFPVTSQKEVFCISLGHLHSDGACRQVLRPDLVHTTLILTPSTGLLPLSVGRRELSIGFVQSLYTTLKPIACNRVIISGTSGVPI